MKELQTGKEINKYDALQHRNEQINEQAEDWKSLHNERQMNELPVRVTIIICQLEGGAVRKAGDARNYGNMTDWLFINNDWLIGWLID